MKFKKICTIVIMLIMILFTFNLRIYAEKEQKYKDSNGSISIAISPGASVDGSAMTSHINNSGIDTFHISIVSEADYEPETMRLVLRRTNYGSYKLIGDPMFSSGEIPQVRHTNAYINAAYPFQNEAQVGMSQSTIDGRKELINPAGWFDIAELQRIALERAFTAREAIQIMGSLAEEYGFATSGESICVIDPNEVWYFEIYGPGSLWNPRSDVLGCVWIAQRVPEGETGVYCNRSRIGAVDLGNSEYFMASSNIFSLAEKKGWWSKENDKEFKVYETYGFKEYSAYYARREWRVLNLLAPEYNLHPWMERYPFSVKPAKLVTVQDIIRIHRDYYQGTEFDLSKGLAAGPFNSPNRYPTPQSQNPEGGSGWERAIASINTNYSTIVVARKGIPDPIGAYTWFGYGSPLTTCYFPIYSGITELPDSFKKGMRGGSYDIFSRESAWWAFNFVSNWAELKYSSIIRDIRSVRKVLEADFFASQSIVEKDAVKLYKQNPKLAKTFLTYYSITCADRTIETYWGLASQLVGRYANGYVYGDNYYRLDINGYPDWWREIVNFGKSTIPPAGSPK